MQSIPPPDSWGGMACGHVNLGLAAECFGTAHALYFRPLQLRAPGSQRVPELQSPRSHSQSPCGWTLSLFVTTNLSNLPHH